VSGGKANGLAAVLFSDDAAAMHDTGQKL